MKKVLFFIAILSLAGSDLFAQKSNTSLQFNIGLSLSGLHKYPEIVYPTCDDCFITESYNHWIAGNTEISIFKQLTKRHELKLGIGYDDVRFHARGADGWGTTKVTLGSRYITLAVGHRLKLFKSKKYTFYIANAPVVNFKFRKQWNQEKKYQFSWRSDLSVKKAIRDKIELIGALFYKVRSGYNYNGYGNRSYYHTIKHQTHAFNLGIEMGVVRKL